MSNHRRKIILLVITSMLILLAGASWAQSRSTRERDLVFAAQQARQQVMATVRALLSNRDGRGYGSHRAWNPTVIPYAAEIRHAAITHRVPQSLLTAVVRCESGFKPRARSRVGALGLTQLMPRTARFMGFDGEVRRLYHPETNLNYGAKYLRHLIDRHGNLWTVLVAWNYGEGNYRRTGRVPRETIIFIACVDKARKKYLAMGT